MRKLLIVVAIVGLIGLILFTYTIYRVTEENRVVRGVTIVVQTPDRMPIPHTVVRLKMLEKNVDIRIQTDGIGKVIFQKLTQGTYSIHAAKVYCAGGARGAEVMTLMIDKSHSNIFYYPCG